MTADSLILRSGENEMAVTHESSGLDAASITFADGNAFDVRRTSLGAYRVAQGERSWLAVCASDGNREWVFLNGEVYVIEVHAKDAVRRRRATSSVHGLTAPMPASVRKIMVAVGQSVKKGETLLVLEAMKMEMPVKSPLDGVVKKINCQPNQLVQPDVQLIELE